MELQEYHEKEYHEKLESTLEGEREGPGVLIWKA